MNHRNTLVEAFSSAFRNWNVIETKGGTQCPYKFESLCKDSEAVHSQITLLYICQHRSTSARDLTNCNKVALSSLVNNDKVKRPVERSRMKDAPFKPVSRGQIPSPRRYNISQRHKRYKQRSPWRSGHHRGLSFTSHVTRRFILIEAYDVSPEIAHGRTRGSSFTGRKVGVWERKVVVYENRGRITKFLLPVGTFITDNGWSARIPLGNDFSLTSKCSILARWSEEKKSLFIHWTLDYSGLFVDNCF